MKSLLRHALLAVLCASCALAETRLRVVAANLSSHREQAYSPDNASHGNPEGAGARIIKALQPDIVLMQEFNTTVPTRQWVNGVFGKEFSFAKEEGVQIPNGVVSRFPIVASGDWDDPIMENREFFWAQIRLPEKRDLWVVSVHFHSKSGTNRDKEAQALVKWVRKTVPKEALLILGGDFNTRGTSEDCLRRLKRVVEIPAELPQDISGNTATNTPRNRPYDWVLASEQLHARAVPVRLAGLEYVHGLVFDTRVFPKIAELPPAQPGDSGVAFMQHMAVVRDFVLP